MLEASVPLLEFLNPVRRGPAVPLSSVTAADHFWQMLPREDPIAAQSAVSEALGGHRDAEPSSLGQFRALLALDQLARSPVERLLLATPRGTPRRWNEFCNRPMRSAGPSARRSSIRCGRSRTTSPLAAGASTSPPFCCACSSIGRSNSCCGRSAASIPIPMAGPGSTPAYRYAESTGMLHQPLVVRRCHDDQGEVSTLEREYIHILLLQLLNGGHPALRSILAEPASSLAGARHCRCKRALPVRWPSVPITASSSISTVPRGLARPSWAAIGHASVPRSCSDTADDPRRDGIVERSCRSGGPFIAVAAWPPVEVAGHGQRELSAQAGADRSSRRSAFPSHRPLKPSWGLRRSRGCCTRRCEGEPKSRHRRCARSKQAARPSRRKTR